MVKPIVPSASDVAKKWSDEAPRRAPYYEAETPKAAGTWEANTTLAASTFKTAITAADIDKRFSGGVKRAGAAKFSRKVTSVGVGRYGPGITAAKDDMQKGIDPVLSAIAATEIPARKPRGDPGNYDRSSKIGVALNKDRLARLAAG